MEVVFFGCVDKEERKEKEGRRREFDTLLPVIEVFFSIYSLIIFSVIFKCCCYSHFLVVYFMYSYIRKRH
jgi:hypothetical protein